MQSCRSHYLALSQQRAMDVVIHAGYLLTDYEIESLGSVDDYPNIARWLIYFTPERIVDYMTANCSTSKVGGNTVSGWLERDDFGPFLGKHSSFWEFRHHLGSWHHVSYVQRGWSSLSGV
jgi:hypothetical protein